MSVPADLRRVRPMFSAGQDLVFFLKFLAARPGEHRPCLSLVILLPQKRLVFPLGLRGQFLSVVR